MEVDESGVPEACPEIVAPFWSQLTLSWVSPFCKLVSNSKQQSLRASQLWPLPPRESPEAICSAFQKAWKEKNQERVTSKRQRVLARVLWHLSWRPFAVASVFMFLYYPFSASTPLVVRSLISFVSIHKNADADPPPLWHGVALVVLLVLCTSTQQLGILQYFYRCSRTGVALRAALCQAIMSKALRLPSGTIDNGEVCTLMSNDAERILVAAPFLQYIWAIPVQVVSVMLLLWSEVGSASLGGVAVLLLLMPIQAKISHWASRLRRQQLKITSLRVQTLGEALSLMRGLLLTSWDEEVFNHLVLLRRSELSFVARSLLLKGLNAALLFTTPVIVALVTFSLYSHVVSNDGISVVVAYTTLGYFSLLRWPLAMLPKVVSGLAEAWVSIERLEHFLLMDDHLPISEISTVDGIAVCIDHCDLGWNSSPRLLQDLCCQVPVGSLALILGPVGCGKSTFLLAIAGECPKQRGSLSRLKSIGLVTAQPWLVNASVRENILVGRGFEPTWYQAVLKACSLTVDLLGWDKGDATLLGERGQAISGGQRQRIALARACYGKPDLALLDDPVSALDPPTGASVWQQVVLGLLANSTRIVATSRPDSTSDADMCLVLSRGSLLREEAAQNELERLTKALVAVGETAEAESVDKQIVPALQPRTQIFQEETKRSGRVGMNVWRCWTRNCGLGSVPMLVGLFLLCQAGCTMADYFLGKWAESHDDREPYNDRESGTSAWMFAWVFVSIATMLLTMLRASLFMRGSVRTAKILHEHALRRVFEAPIGWFEATPTGRTLNRFGRDLDMIDSLLPPFVEDACVRITEIIGVLVLVMVIAPVAILPSLVVLWFMVRLHRAIQPAIIETKRLDGVLASPMYTAFSDMLVGIEVIRTSRLEDLWIERHISSLEPYSRATFMHHACNRYFGMRLCALSNVVLGSTALVSVMLVRLDLPTVSAVSVGLLLVYSMQLSFAFSALMQQAVEAENNLSAVERVHDCAVEEDVLKYRFEKCIRPHESAAATSVGHCWPTNGAMLFSDLYVSYSIKDQLHQCVLRGVSFQVDSGECIGIVGRSGSGKSSLLAAIFGMAHVAKGTISIDGVDLATVPVALVRKRLAMIPQQPVIFSGTIRSNLVRECTDVLDEKLWNVLAAVGLHDTFRTLGKGLDSDVGIAGNSLSSGQQQLLSLARALLRNCPILVLDEATSHVDATTEQTFKTVLRGPQLSEAKSTVISVAHRPESLTVADRIIHVVDGQIRQVAQSSQVASI